MYAEEGSEADKNPHGKSGGNVPGMGIQGEDFFELLLELVNRYHVSLFCRPLYDFAVCFVNLIDFTSRFISDITLVE